MTSSRPISGSDAGVVVPSARDGGGDGDGRVGFADRGRPNGANSQRSGRQPAGAAARGIVYSLEISGPRGRAWSRAAT
jgi:hypothetical protein